MAKGTTSIRADLAANQTRVPWWRRAELVAAAAAIVCFLNVLPNDFCYDDDPIVRFNPKVNSPGQWLAVWTTDHWWETQDATPNRDLLYRPVSLSSYRLVRIVGGVHPLPHHLLNVILHALSCALIARLCRRLGGAESAALIAGTLFAVLPIHTEAVAAVVGRADLLATLGVLLALLMHRRSMTAATRLGVASWRAAAALAAFAAMGSKESGISVVALTVLMDAYWHRHLREPIGGRRWWAWGTLMRLAYLLIPLGVYLVLRGYALGGRLYQQPPATKTINVLVDAPTWQHVLGVIQLWGMYWAKTVWPHILSVKYSINSIRLATSPMDPHVVIGALILVGLVVASVVAWRNGVRSVAFLSAVLGLSYLPTANAMVLMQVFFAERVWYLPSVWIAILAGLAIMPLMRRPASWMVFGLLALAMTARCWLRNVEWQDNRMLYAAAYLDQPDAVGPLQLYGQWLVHHGQYERGVELLNRAIEIDLGFTDAHCALGEAYLQADDLATALHHLQMADMQAPGHPPTEQALARVSRELSERDEELKHLAQRVDENPGDVDAEVALVRRLRELGRAGEALARLRQREHLFGEHVTWQAEYAVTLVYLNDRDRAIERYRKCLELDPDDPQRAAELAMLLLERREDDDLDEAWQWATHAAKIAPHAPAVLGCRAELLAVRGDLAAAVALYDQAIRILPPDGAQRRVFEQRAKALGRKP